MAIWRTVIYTIQGCVGLVTNLLVIIVILKTPMLRKIDSVKLIANQSLIDAVTSLCLMFSYLNLHNSGVHLTYSDGNISDQLKCFFWAFDRPLWGFFVSSTANLLLMTIIKYMQIVFPLWYKTKFSVQRLPWLQIGMAICWIIGPLYACIVFSTRVKVINNKCNLSAWSNPKLGQFLGVLTICLQFFFPVALLVFCYTHMWLVIKKRWKQIRPAGHSGEEKGNQSTLAPVSQIAVSTAPYSVMSEKQNEKNMKVQKNIVLTLLSVSLCFILCWVWRSFQFLLENLGLQNATENYGTFMHQFGTLAIFTNCLINPFVYIAMFKNFRSAAKAICFK